MTSSKSLLLAAALCLASGAALAQQPVQLPNPFQGLFKGTPEEQRACHPDATKFCQQAGNDELRVLSCLQQNRAKISAACDRVLRSHGQ
ncbi:MAG TPA: cysteine rich repeat-containing protein [Xanthobacteraceae bacterium]|nr:cysteine rich repeat-containing protein [Xanthobacteraceae bacterium]